MNKNMDTYEKKYNEALERARKIHDEILNNELLGFPEQIREIFPELRESESEDERVIRTLYYLVRDHDWLNGATKEEVLSWLEKQKEQKPAEWSEKDEKMIERLITRLNWITYNTRTDGTSPNITFFDEIDWLKSLRPSWKPSEEQMKQLHYALTPGSAFDCDILNELYIQLKKLK